MPTETLTQDGRVATVRVVTPADAEDEEALRAEAAERIRRRRTFRVHLVVVPLVMAAVGVVWLLTEYYVAHTAHTWPTSFSDAPADRAGVWDTWYFYFAGVCLVLLAVDAYRTYAKPYMGRHVARTEVDRELARLKTP